MSLSIYYYYVYTKINFVRLFNFKQYNNCHYFLQITTLTFAMMVHCWWLFMCWFSSDKPSRSTGKELVHQVHRAFQWFWGTFTLNLVEILFLWPPGLFCRWEESFAGKEMRVLCVTWAFSEQTTSYIWTRRQLVYLAYTKLKFYSLLSVKGRRNRHS